MNKYIITFKFDKDHVQRVINHPAKNVEDIKNHLINNDKKWFDLGDEVVNLDNVTSFSVDHYKEPEIGVITHKDLMK